MSAIRERLRLVVLLTIVLGSDTKASLFFSSIQLFSSLSETLNNHLKSVDK